MSFPIYGFLSILAIGPCTATPHYKASTLSETELLEQIQTSSIEKDKTLSMLQLAERYRLSGRINEAKSLYSAANKSSSATTFTHSIDVGLALIYASQNNTKEAVRTLEENMERRDIFATQRASIYAELARQAFMDGDQETVAYYAQLAREKSIPQNKEQVEKTLGSLGTQDYTTPSPTPVEESSTSPMEEIQKSMKEGELEQAATFIGTLAKQTLDEKTQKYIQAAELRIEANDPFFADKLGVMLPISHEKYAPVATAFQQSIEYSNNQLSMPFQLVFFDTKGDPLEAQNGVKQLVTQDGCSAILGPLLKTTVQGAAQSAQLFEVPMLTLSKENTPLSEGDFIFYVNLSPERQLSDLIEHHITEKQNTRFASLAPDTESSKELINQFEQEVLRMNGTFVRSQFYPPETTDFRETARIFSDKTDPKIKPEDIDQIPPRADFDVLFIPDNYRKTPLITSALAYEGFKIGSFDAGHDIPKTHIIGLNSWNNPKIIRSSGQYMIGGLFMDAIWMNSKTPDFTAFRDGFVDALQRNPNIFDAILFDTLRFAALAHKSASRYELQSNIQTQSISKALTGGLRFREDRELDRALILLELKKDGIYPWLAPEE
ncbi:MAG: hypothetical protein CL916_15100 [Deltaproteobacteria bacterium]|nr:hypothetical protein [Deltaproteobacteria bacterium]